MVNNILITGCAGFIGFSITKSLLEKKIRIIGIDNLNKYYNVKLKKARLKILKKKNFSFYKYDLRKKSTFQKLIKKKIDLVIHFAAQPGVRYSYENPDSYVENNVQAFLNILNFARQKKIDLIYASSSSVYGDAKFFPVKETDFLRPKNIYAITKRNNEEMAEIYSKSYNMRIIGLRFFTVFGEWGRPDMMILKYFDYCSKNKKFPLYNKGNFFRDFTYINDLVKLTLPLIFKKNKFKKCHTLLNISTGKPIKVGLLLNKLINLVSRKLIVNLKPKQPEVFKTFGDNTKIKKISKLKQFENIDIALKKTYTWYQNYKTLFK